MSALNQLILHPTLISIAEKLLGTTDIRMSQADAWAKFFSDSAAHERDNRDQRMHIDGWNHTLVVPCDCTLPRLP